jgi:hypothetical protein
MFANRSMYIDLDNDELIDRMSMLHAELDGDLDDTNDNVSYVLDNIECIVDILRERVNEANSEDIE